MEEGLELGSNALNRTGESQEPQQISCNSKKGLLCGRIFLFDGYGGIGMMIKGADTAPFMSGALQKGRSVIMKSYQI